MIAPKNRYIAFKEAILNAPSEIHCWPFSEKYSEGEVGELLKSVLESTEGQCIEGSEHLVHHVKVASELNKCYKDYYQMMQSLFSKYYCPLNMFLCRIIRFLAKDKPPLKR